MTIDHPYLIEGKILETKQKRKERNRIKEEKKINNFLSFLILFLSFLLCLVSNILPSIHFRPFPTDLRPFAVNIIPDMSLWQ